MKNKLISLFALLLFFTCNRTTTTEKSTNISPPIIDELSVKYAEPPELSTSQNYPEAIQRLINDMVRIQGGDFTMGSNEFRGEKPPHSVHLSSYNIGKYEVTQDQWQAVMGSNPSIFKDCGSRCPVEKVSWNNVQEFITKINSMTGKKFRLPTEAEWEYAARGRRSKGYTYAGSDNIENVAWYSGNSKVSTHVVGTKNPNELGLYDMSGNVREWCNDWYDENYYKNSPRNNPQGPSTAQPYRVHRVIRGGAYAGSPFNCRVAYRYSRRPYTIDITIGFRLAQTP